ncbi:YopX family protein [Enterococcus hirae]|uniref:YopX family protein n=1 Tax=Enterococcus hirae TaxID=1354 RepID=UPI00211D1405|nr:YopX family protein [Enterococcus hirae]
MKLTEDFKLIALNSQAREPEVTISKYGINFSKAAAECLKFSEYALQNGFDYLDNKVCVVKNSIGHSGLVCATVDEDLEYRIFNTELFEEYTYEVIGNIYENPELLEEQR